MPLESSTIILKLMSSNELIVSIDMLIFNSINRLCNTLMICGFYTIHVTTITSKWSSRLLILYMYISCNDLRQKYSKIAMNLLNELHNHNNIDINLVPQNFIRSSYISVIIQNFIKTSLWLIKNAFVNKSRFLDRLIF